MKTQIGWFDPSVNNLGVLVTLTLLAHDVVTCEYIIIIIIIIIIYTTLPKDYN